MTDDEMRAGLHPSARVHATARIFSPVECGKNCIFEAYAILGKEGSDEKISLGANVHIRSGAVIYPGVSVGDNSHFGHNVVVRENCIIGSNCGIGSCCTLDPNVTLGDFVRLQSNITLAPRTFVHDVVFIGPNVVFTDGRHMTGALVAAGEMTQEEIIEMEYGGGEGQIVEDHVRVGAGAVILANVRLGANSVVAAGAVVGEDLPSRTLAVGNPARIMPRMSFLPCEKRE